MSELRKFARFYILKTAILSIFCRYFRYFVGTNDMLVGFLCTEKFPNVPTKLRKSINIEKIYVYMRASGTSELRKFAHFLHSQTAISFNILSVLQILCRYKWHACRLTCTDKISKCTDKTPKSIMGGGGGQFPPPPPLAKLMPFILPCRHCWSISDIFFSQTSRCAMLWFSRIFAICIYFVSIYFPNSCIKD